MRLRLLLIMMLVSSGLFLQAQEDTISTLIFTESHSFRADQSYFELTNMGTEPVQLSNFKVGMIGPWNEIYNASPELQLPNKILDPGKSFVVATVRDYTQEMYPIYPDKFSERITQIEYWEFADMQIHSPESNPAGAATDSVTVNNEVLVTWNGRNGWYLEQHINGTDSVIIDQVGGVFDGTDGRNMDKAYDVAGVTNATGNSILVRKYSIKNGNLDFANARGVGEDDSEWIVIPLPFADLHPWRAAYWTPGNHGDYKLNTNTLVSSTLKVDWTAKTITVPWGVRRLDALVKQFEKKPGLAWFYDLSTSREDSAYVSARTGDKITFYACGSKLERETFDIILEAPKNSDNIVIPKYSTNANGYYGRIISGNADVFKVTENAPGKDTITNSLFGIPYATRVDTLFNYLEKAPNANWEILWVDNIERPDLKNGDVLKVTAENGSVKEYYIKVNGIRPNHNAYLSAITWPDIPEYLKGLYGWKGDTIPNFVGTGFNYTIQIPNDIKNIPALVAKTERLNSSVQVKRATSLIGTKEQRTITFTVSAEDDTTQYVYSVELVKELDPENVQPYNAEPFLSELVFQDMWSNGFVEICNPGNQIIDLSNYMLMFARVASPSDAILQNSAVDNWPQRYMKYVPGYKWVDEAQWSITPGVLVEDLNVNPLVYPGDVFVGGQAASTWGWNASFPGPIANKQTEVMLNTAANPWGEAYDNWASAVHSWCDNEFYLFKILNDSIKAGLKPANDPADFQLIEVFGMGDGSNWNIGGYNGMGGPQCMTFIRKPEYFKGKDAYKGSFGTNEADTEWLRYDPAYWERNGTGWPNNILNDTKDLGKHYMYAVTDYKSTISSVVYKVSEGYKWNESIKGITTGTTAATFLGNVIKANEKQVLTIKGAAGIVEGASALSNTDTLVVMSADSTNITKYILTVSPDGLSSNAVITSSRYTVSIDQQPKSGTEEVEAGIGNVKGFDYGTTLRTIMANIQIPAGATLDIIDGKGAYVPLITLNFDTTYVNVTVNSNTYLSVTAENGVTQIIYQLIPTATEDDAFITSDIYSVAQKDLLIEFVPRGTDVATFLGNLVASAGASLKLLNNMGQERLDGYIALDDKVQVTSPNGNVSKVYYLSMLAEQYIQSTTYLAYIISNLYTVDQVSYKVDGVSGDETVASFLTKVTASMGATAVVIDKNGNEKNSGDIDNGDKVKVTSVDGKITNYYTFGTLTSAGQIGNNSIEMYPNPTSDIINISGVKAGNRIQVYNSVGATIRDINVQNSVERISLRSQPNGIYMIVVSDNNKFVSRFKAIKQ